jgi:hypothetical protein
VSAELQEVVRDKLETAEIHRDPFPHLVIPDLLPEPWFRRLADSVPPLETFEQSKNGIKADMPLDEDDPHFAAAPADFRAAWSVLRDDLLRGTIAPVLRQRLEGEIREKYADLFSAELAERIMADGLDASPGRIMARRPGYDLRPHTDPAHFAVTCLLYFTAARDEASGALCLFRPERTPELHDVSTYYPDREEGIGAELVKTIPIRENLFVAFLNGRESLHGVHIERGSDAGIRLTHQAHVLPRHDIRLEAESFIPELDYAAGERGRRWVDRMREREQAAQA